MGIFDFILTHPLLTILIGGVLFSAGWWYFFPLSWYKVLLRGPLITLQEFACFELGRLDDKRAIEPLIERLDDKNKYTRHAAMNALSNFGNQRARMIEAYEEKLNRGDYEKAARIAKECGLGDEKVKIAAIKIFEDKMRKGAYKEAIEVARYDLGNEKVKIAAIKIFEDKMRKGVYEGAIEVAEKYSLSNEKIKTAAIKIFEKNIEKKEYATALDLANRHELSESHMSRAKEGVLYEYISKLVQNSKCTVREGHSSSYNIEITYNTDYRGLGNTDPRTQVPWGSTPRETILDEMVNIYKNLYSFCFEKNINIEMITLTARHGVNFPGHGWFSHKKDSMTIFSSYIGGVDARSIDWKSASVSETMKIWRVTHDAFPALRFE